MTTRPARRALTILVSMAASLSLVLTATPASAVDTAQDDQPAVRTATGRLVDTKGRPVAGVTVTSCSTVVDTSDLGMCPAGVSAADGSFAINEVTGDSVSVFVLTRSPEVAARRLAPLPGHRLVLDDPMTHLITVHGLMTATGQLVGPDGPLAGASIESNRGQGALYPPFTAVTDAQGRFAIDTYPTSTGLCHLDVTAEDHGARHASQACSWGDRVDFGTLRLRLSRTVTVTATSPDGSALSGFSVHVEQPDGSTYSESTTYPFHGRITLGIGGGDGKPYTIALVPDDPRLYALPVRVVPSATDKHLALTVPTLRYASISARVTTPSGASAESALFDLERHDGARWQHLTMLTVVDGAIEESRLTGGRYRLTVLTQYALPERPREFVLRDAEALDLGTLTARTYAAGHRAGLTFSRPTVSADHAYAEGRFPTVRATISDTLDGHPLPPIDLIDASGKVVGTAELKEGSVTAKLPSDKVGTQSGFRFRARGDAHYAETVSAAAPPHSIRRQPTTLGAARLSARTTSWDEPTSVTVAFSGAMRGSLEVLVDGKVVRTEHLGGRGVLTQEDLVFPLPTLSLGKHKIQVRRVASPTDAGATSTVATITATRATLSARPSVTARSFKRGTRPTVRVTIPRTTGGGATSGKVKVYVGKKVVKTVRVTTKSRTPLVIKLPQRCSKTIKVRAVYVGGSKYKGATSRTITVKVRR